MVRRPKAGALRPYRCLVSCRAPTVSRIPDRLVPDQTRKDVSGRDLVLFSVLPPTPANSLVLAAAGGGRDVRHRRRQGLAWHTGSAGVWRHDQSWKSTRPGSQKQRGAAPRRTASLALFCGPGCPRELAIPCKDGAAQLVTRERH